MTETTAIYSLIAGLEAEAKELEVESNIGGLIAYHEWEIIKAKIEALKQVAGAVEAVFKKHEDYEIECYSCYPVEVKEEILGTRAEAKK